MEFSPAKCEHLQITNKYSFIDAHALASYMLFDHAYYTKSQLPLLA